jgi:predicted acylesterase/phospholipase RssA
MMPLSIGTSLLCLVVNVCLLRTSVHGFVPSAHPTSIRTREIYTDTSTSLSETPTPSDNDPATPNKSKLNKLKFLRLARDNKEIRQAGESSKSKKQTPEQYNVTSVEDLDTYFADPERRFRDEKGEIDYDALLKALYVQGDTQNIGSPDNPAFTHPVAKLLHARKRNNSTLANRGDNDKHRIALSIEGGGMRGCVSAGMICAVDYLNLTQSIDVVYGSSAGTVVGSYLITGQLPWFGPEVYYDRLTTAGRKFIDSRRLLRALGFGLLDPRLFKDVLTRRGHGGKPVLNLPFLLKTTVQDTKPLNWATFVDRQQVQPLKVVASGLKSEKAIVLDYQSGAFATLEELTDCMHASCLLPGIAGPVMNLDTRALKGQKVPQKHVLGNDLKGDHWEPMADALIFEPLPYRSAIDEGCTHVLVVRSRPDGVEVTGKGGIFERLIFSRFFLRKNRLPNIYKRLKMQLHKKTYAEDILRLNKEARSERDYNDTSQPHLMAVATPPGSPEVTRLETGREAIFEGFRRGFARSYDCLVEDPAERGRGHIVAKEYFPDEILDYDPLSITATDVSAFEAYMRDNNVTPRVHTSDAQAGAAAVEDNLPLR